MSHPSFGELDGEDPYAILGLEHGANDDDVRRARKRLLRRYHPDLPGGDLRRAKMVTAASDILLDPLRRRGYLDMVAANAQRFSASGAWGTGLGRRRRHSNADPADGPRGSAPRPRDGSSDAPRPRDGSAEASRARAAQAVYWGPAGMPDGFPFPSTSDGSWNSPTGSTEFDYSPGDTTDSRRSRASFVGSRGSHAAPTDPPAWLVRLDPRAWFAGMDVRAVRARLDPRTWRGTPTPDALTPDAPAPELRIGSLARRIRQARIAVGRAVLRDTRSFRLSIAISVLALVGCVILLVTWGR